MSQKNIFTLTYNMEGHIHSSGLCQAQCRTNNISIAIDHLKDSLNFSYSFLYPKVNILFIKMYNLILFFLCQFS